MDRKNNQKTQTNPIFIISGVLFLLVSLNILFIMLFQSELNSYKLTQKEMVMLDQDRRIITASTDIAQKYKTEISAISGVFPNEQNFPEFIQNLENELKNSVDEYQFKFSPNPMAESDKLFLLMTINIKTDFPKLLNFLGRLEQMPYMMHITGIVAKSPGGILGKGEYSLGMKVYVQNPFKSK